MGGGNEGKYDLELAQERNEVPFFSTDFGIAQRFVYRVKLGPSSPFAVIFSLSFFLLGVSLPVS